MERVPKATGALGDSLALQPFRKASLLPFDQLPSLPKPKIPFIDLDIGTTVDVRAIRYVARPSVLGL